MLGRPSGPQDRPRPAKLEIPFGHAFDKHRVLLFKSAVPRRRPVRLRPAIEECAVLGVLGVGPNLAHYAGGRQETRNSKYVCPPLGRDSSVAC